MRSVVFVTLTLLFLSSGTTVVLSELPRPSNVRITSLNMGLLLEWDGPQDSTENVTYTAEFKSYVQTFKAVCRNTTALHCDFTSELKPFGVYSFRVRAQLQGESSSWVETDTFTMDEHTTIGSPTVILNTVGVDIEVTIKDPVFWLTGLRDVYASATYHITYWKEGQRDKAMQLNDVVHNRVVLSRLESWTKYCVQVQVKTKRFNKHSQPSNVVCESTNKGTVALWVVALGIIVGVAGLVALVVCGVLYCRTLVRFFCPKVKVPEHFKEYLLEPPHSSVFLAMQNSTQPEEVYHSVCIMEEAIEWAADAENPLWDTKPGGTQPDQAETMEGER